MKYPYLVTSLGVLVFTAFVVGYQDVCTPRADVGGEGSVVNDVRRADKERSEGRGKLRRHEKMLLSKVSEGGERPAQIERSGFGHQPEFTMSSSRTNVVGQGSIAKVASVAKPVVEKSPTQWRQPDAVSFARSRRPVSDSVQVFPASAQEQVLVNEIVSATIGATSIASATAASANSEVLESVTNEVMVRCLDPRPQAQATVWTMFNVNTKLGQADCHLLELPVGKKVLIDAGEGYDAQGTALESLRSAGVTRLDLVILSHMHWDHYGKLIEIINGGIAVDRVALSLPGSRDIADVELPWGCNWDDVQALLLFLRERGIPYWIPVSGEKLMEISQNGVLTTLEVVCVFDGLNTPVGRTDINDTSMVVRLHHGKMKALFTGDLNHTIGSWLAASGLDLAADLLKVPHHGTDGLAPNEFFDRVGAKAALVPSPHELWYSLRSKRARSYFSERNIPAFVNGRDGAVRVWIGEDTFEISTAGVPQR